MPGRKTAPRGVVTRSRARRASRRIRPTPAGGKGKTSGPGRSVHGNTVTVMQSTEYSLKRVLLMHMDSVADGLAGGPRCRPHLNRALRTKLRALIHRYHGQPARIRRFVEKSWEEEEEKDADTDADADDEATEKYAPQAQGQAVLPERSQSEASHVEFEVKLKI